MSRLARVLCVVQARQRHHTKLLTLLQAGDDTTTIASSMGRKRTVWQVSLALLKTAAEHGRMSAWNRAKSGRIRYLLAR